MLAGCALTEHCDFGLSRYRLKTLKAYRSSFSVLLVIFRSPRSAPSSYILRTVVRS